MKNLNTMKFMFFVISFALFVVGILGLINKVPKFMFPNEQFSFMFLLLSVALLGIIYSTINPLLIFYEKGIIFFLMGIVILVALLPYVSTILTIKLNISTSVRAVIAIIVSAIGLLYSVFAPA